MQGPLLYRNNFLTVNEVMDPLENNLQEHFIHCVEAGDGTHVINRVDLSVVWN